jgi:hypothetical protein
MTTAPSNLHHFGTVAWRYFGNALRRSPKILTASAHAFAVFDGFGSTHPDNVISRISARSRASIFGSGSCCAMSEHTI